MTAKKTPNTSPSSAIARRGLMRSGLVVSAMTMLSRVLGLARDVVIATLLGAGDGADAFFVAFKIPNFLRRLFAEGAFNQAFVPVLSEYSTQRSREEIRALLNATVGSLTAVLALITALAMLCAPWLIWVFAPGFGSDPDKLALTADMLRLTFPYLLLISLTAVALDHRQKIPAAGARTPPLSAAHSSVQHVHGTAEGWLDGRDAPHQNYQWSQRSHDEPLSSCADLE